VAATLEALSTRRNRGSVGAAGRTPHAPQRRRRDAFWPRPLAVLRGHDGSDRVPDSNEREQCEESGCRSEPGRAPRRCDERERCAATAQAPALAFGELGTAAAAARARPLRSRRPVCGRGGWRAGRRRRRRGGEASAVADGSEAVGARRRCRHSDGRRLGGGGLGGTSAGGWTRCRRSAQQAPARPLMRSGAHPLAGWRPGARSSGRSSRAVADRGAVRAAAMPGSRSTASSSCMDSDRCSSASSSSSASSAVSLPASRSRAGSPSRWDSNRKPPRSWQRELAPAAQGSARAGGSPPLQEARRAGCALERPRALDGLGLPVSLRHQPELDAMAGGGVLSEAAGPSRAYGGLSGRNDSVTPDERPAHAADDTVVGLDVHRVSTQAARSIVERRALSGTVWGVPSRSWSGFRGRVTGALRV